MGRPREWPGGTADLIKELSRTNKKMSASEMVVHLGNGKSRSALIAYCRRNGIRLPIIRARRSDVKNPAAPPNHNISLYHANDTHCRHLEPRRDEHDHPIVCGAPATRGSYCEEHARKYYAPEEMSRRARQGMRKALRMFGR